jgi:hypothetical protein
MNRVRQNRMQFLPKSRNLGLAILFGELSDKITREGRKRRRRYLCCTQFF